MKLPQITKILYATDLTKNSAYAFSYAIDMARKNSATVVILHVLPPFSPSVYGEAGPRVEEILKEGKKREREMDIEEIKRNIQDFCKRAEIQLECPCVQIVSEILVTIGHTVDEILKTAEDEGCDAIVLGTHGKGFLRHTFLGSVAADVLARTRKPVFIIPLPSDKTDIEWKRI